MCFILGYLFRNKINGNLKREFQIVNLQVSNYLFIHATQRVEGYNSNIVPNEYLWHRQNGL